MTRSPSIAAMLLAALAGYIDAVAYQSLGGFFASFMTGNVTRLGIGLVTGESGVAQLAAALLLAFLSGVIAGSVVGHAAGHWRAPAAMALVAALIAVAAWVPIPHPLGPMMLAVAMGAENAAGGREGSPRLGLTYLTGTLVLLGERLAGAMMRTDTAWNWLAPFGMLIGFVAGVVFGAQQFQAAPIRALDLAVAAASALVIVLALLAAGRRGRGAPTVLVTPSSGPRGNA